jgi:glyoxylase I family protein
VQKVTGIGGVCFRARDLKALALRYRATSASMLFPTITMTRRGSNGLVQTAYAPFPEDSKYFGNPAKQWMINFRVSNLEAMVLQLKSAGIAVDVDPEHYPKAVSRGCMIPKAIPSSCGSPWAVSKLLPAPERGGTTPAGLW